MIPQRIKLSGFLSYKDEQEIRFTDAPLWMLSGTNGSGKSSIFDAVTYSLFGHHRGGSQSAAELINKESNTLDVEFDFTVEHQLYRIKRTVRTRKSGVASTQQVLKKLPDDDWEAIADTNYKAKFDAWVKNTIGLDYETFTSSVLLLQGKSEKLLDSTPTGRAQVLARIVDLERYQKLHAKADEKRRALKGRLEGIANQLAGIREVTDEELTAASERIEQGKQSRNHASQRIDDLVSLEQQAIRWSEARRKLVAANQKLTGAQSVLGHALAIEKDSARLRELRDVLPAVTIIVSERGRIAESERKTDDLTKKRLASFNDHQEITHQLQQSRGKLDNLKKTLQKDEVEQGKLNTRLRELAAMLEKVKQVEEAEREIANCQAELKRLPADPENAVRTLEREQERLTLLAQQLAPLERLHRERSELIQAHASQQDAQSTETRLKDEGLRAKAAFTQTEKQAKEARDQRSRADQAVASARALAQQARELANEFTQLLGEKSCRACGQPLTPAHFDTEKAKRNQEADEAERKLATLLITATTAKKREEELTQQETRERHELEGLRDRYKDASAAANLAKQEITRLIASCRQTYFGLPDEFKQKVGVSEPTDWATVTYPDRNHLNELSQQAHGLDTVRGKLRQAQDVAKTFQKLQANLQSATERLGNTRLGLAVSNPESLRHEHATKQSEEASLTRSIAGTKQAITTAEKEIDHKQKQLSGRDIELTELNGKLVQEEQSRKQSQEAIDRAKKALPAAWERSVETAGLTDRAKWQDEFGTLTNNETEKKYTQLQAARTGLESLRAEITIVQQEVEAFPLETHREPAEVKAEIAAARSELDSKNAQLVEAQGQKRDLDQLRTSRGDLGVQYKAVDSEHNRFKLLAELLGRERLQRFLVRTAERQIVEYANAVLDRLSGGQLFLKLVGSDDGSSEKALELECANRVTGGSAINVAFLSGSQRFRVAVALALGIGQYASKQHRPIESVIIDEGFGCLDRAGRQVMIQELQNLRGQLQCILLVSHQEEFAEAFPDGYRFELRDGATHIDRFVR